MRKTAVIAAFAVLVGGFLIGNLQPAVSQAPPNQTLTFFDPNKTDFEKQVNVGRRGFSAGDWTVIKDRFFNPETCERVGVMLGRFTFVKSAGRNDGYFLMDAGMILPDGKMTFYWPGRFTEFENPTAVTTGAAVTGGTGAYADAGGRLVVEEGVEMCDKRGALVTIELEP